MKEDNIDRVLETSPGVTLGRGGIIYLNAKAFEAIRRAGTVELLFDATERVIGLRKCDPRYSR